MRLRVSKQGNLIEVIRGLNRECHRMVLNTAGMGDRRVRKQAAKAAMDCIIPPPPTPPPERTVASGTAEAMSAAWRGPGVASSSGAVLTLTFTLSTPA